MASSKSHIFTMWKGRREGKGGKRDRETDRQTGQRSLTPGEWGGRWKRQLTAGASSHSLRSSILMKGNDNQHGVWGRRGVRDGTEV